MRSIALSLLLLPLLATLAGCASDSGIRPQPVPAPRAAAAAAPAEAPLARVMGRDAAALAALFGPPALDVREGPARKLQFRGTACTLDAYLYPPAGGGAPEVTWVDARLPAGGDLDRAACIVALARPIAPIRR